MRLDPATSVPELPPPTSVKQELDFVAKILEQDLPLSRAKQGHGK
jgi:hypothetical protein